MVCVGNTYFEHKSLHKYTRLERGQNGVKVKSMIDVVLVKYGIWPFRSPCCTVLRQIGGGMN